MYFRGKLYNIEIRGDVTTPGDDGYTTGKPSTQVVIHINPNIEQTLSCGNYATHTLAYLSILLREMVHAYFLALSCDGEVCKEQGCATAFWGEIGYTGHTEAFLDLAKRIEDGINSEGMYYVYLRLDLSAQSEDNVVEERRTLMTQS